ncbi:MAG: hypothetical protein QM764_11455 [Chitinophagaceae bacterium]
MNLIGKIFRRNMVDCPRCLGKGHVDMQDIKRLKKELFWVPGKCAYCNGIGKVPLDRVKKISADCEYLTTALTSLERHKVINADADALKRASEYRDRVRKMIEEIEHLYYVENKESDEIANYILRKQRRFVYSSSEKQEVIDYVEKVINSKLGK